MWCDNCCLIFPLSAGSMALAALIGIHSVLGAILLFLYGEFWFFGTYEPDIYGSISTYVTFVAILSIISISNRGYTLLKTTLYLWALAILVSGIRAGLMLVRLKSNEDQIQWECANNGTLWNSTIANANSTTTNMTNHFSFHEVQNSTSSSSSPPPVPATLPSEFCRFSYHDFYVIWLFSLLIDIVLQVYMWFLQWRSMKKIVHYFKAMSTIDPYEI